MAGGVRDLRETLSISRLGKNSSIKNSDLPDQKILHMNYKSINSPDSGFCAFSHNDSDSDWCSNIDAFAGKSLKPAKKVFHLPGLLHKTKSESNPPNVTGSSSFETLLGHLDSDVVTNWLTTSNHNIEELAEWIATERNFCEFSHFWLTTASKEEKINILKMEYAIIIDELCFALASGLDKTKSLDPNLQSLAKTVFHEFPDKISESMGDFLFLDYLSILTSTKKNEYKHLLSDIKCSLNFKQHIQGLLSIRSFALINVWSGVVNFFRKIQNSLEAQQNNNCKKVEPCKRAEKQLSSMAQMKSDLDVKRLFEAMRLSYLDVVNYLIKTKKVELSYKDERKKSLFFHAVIMDRPDILKYFLDQLDDSPITSLVNEPADNGNTPLHASINMCNVECVKALHSCPYVDLNVPNEFCNGATPLHLAIMLGRKEIVKLLLDGKADASLKMGGMSALQMAEHFCCDPDICTLLKCSTYEN